MTRALQLAGIVALLAWALVGVQLVYTLERVNEASAATTSAIQEAQRRVAHTSQNANAVLVQLSLAADQWRLASMNQAKYARQLEAALDETTNMVREGRRTLEVAREQIERNGNASQKAIEEVGAVAAGAQTVLGHADEGVRFIANASSSLPRIAEHLADASANTASSAKHVEAATASVANAAESVDQALRPLRTSGGKMKAVLKFLLGLVKVNVL